MKTTIGVVSAAITLLLGLASIYNSGSLLRPFPEVLSAILFMVSFVVTLVSLLALKTPPEGNTTSHQLLQGFMLIALIGGFFMGLQFVYILLIASLTGVSAIFDVLGI